MTEGMPASSSTAGRTVSASFLGATSARKMAVITPMGTPMSIAKNVPTMDVSMTKRIPKLGEAAAGCHAVPKMISSIPTLNSAGVPLMIMYNVMDATASTAKKPQPVKMACAAFSTVDLLLWWERMEIVSALMQGSLLSDPDYLSTAISPTDLTISVPSSE